MRAITIAVLVFALGQAEIASADPIPLLKSAERAARETAPEASAARVELQQQSEPRRRRSIGRTVGGIVLMGIGAPMFIVGMAASEDVGGTTCFNGDCITVAVDTGGLGKGVAAAGGGMLVIGALLASVWSDVPVVNNLDFSVTPGRAQVSKTFGF